MSKAGTHSELVLALAEEFVARYRQGERPSLREYIDRHPELAAEIREVFPAMALMENIALVQEEESTPAPAAPEPLPLQQLGDYRLIRVVGHGGMGIVYEAEQVSLGRHVALKLLPRKMLADVRHRRRFEREARLAAKLHHTNIVPVFGVGEQDGLPYYVMQFIQGLGLDQVLEELKRLRAAGEGNLPAAKAETPAGNDLSAADMARSLLTGQFEPVPPDSGPDPSRAEQPAGQGGGKSIAAPSVSHLKSLSASSVVLPGQSGPSGQRKAKPLNYWQSVAQIGVQVAQALEYARQQGVLHRDIKPSNLLLDRRTTVWVTDFGLAKASDSEDLTHTGDVLGTLRYMPPEAFEGKSDARSDIYSLGLTLYELLAFRPAFEEKDRHKLVKQVTTGEPPRLDRLHPEVPRDLVTIVHKAIDRDPRQRYATAGELAADLQRFTDDEPIMARRIGAVERLIRWCRHNPMLASSLSAVAATLVLGTVVAWLLAAWALKEAGRALREAYTAKIRLIQPAWDSHNLLQVHQLLDETAAYPERGFEWYYWQRLSHFENLALVGHRGGITSVAFAPDGKRLATGGKDATARIWVATSGQELFCLHGHQSEVTAVAFAPKGQWLVTSSTDGTAKLWDLSRGRELRSFQATDTGSVWAVAVTPDGRRIVTGSQDGLARVWDAESGQQLLTLDGRTALPALGASTVALLCSPQAQAPMLASSLLCPGRMGHAQAIWAIAVTPDGKRVITGDEQNLILLWDSASGRLLRSFIGPPAWVELGINSIAVSPDGKRLVTASNDNTTRAWEMETGKELRRISRTGYSTCVAVFPDGQRLAAASGVSDIETGRDTLSFRGQLGAVNSLAISPDGRRLALASLVGTARIWNVESGGASRTLKGHRRQVLSVTVTADGQWIITGSADRTAKIWDVPSGQVLFTLEGHMDGVDAVAVSADRQRIITGSSDITADGRVYGAVRIWDAVSGHLLQKLDGDTRDIRSIAVTPDGRWLVTGGLPAAQVWDMTSSRKPRTLTPPSFKIITSVALDKDGQRVFTGCLDGTTRLWDIQSGKELFQVQERDNAVMSFAVSPRRQRLVTGRLDGVVTVWDMASERELFSLRAHTSHVTSIAMTPDEQRIITGSEDGTVKIWDAVTGRELLVLDGHSGPVNSLAVTPDGRQLVTACDDGTVKIWEAASAEEVARWTLQEQEMERRLALWQRPGRSAPGFIHDWLVLGPLALKENETPAKGLERQQLPEASLHPRAGHRALVDGQQLTWQAHLEHEPTLDLNRFLGEGRSYCAAYVVCYVKSATERSDLLLQVASCEQAKVYLNGQQIYQYTRGGTPALEPIGPVRLRKGMNVLLVKNVKDTRNWNVCARFVDLEGNPAQGLEVCRTPD